MTRWLTAALAAVVLAGCSMVRVGYNQLDTLAAWTADDYFDLDAQQKNQFRIRFARLHDWHRHEALPDYARLLAQAQARFDKGLTRKDVFWMIEAVKERYRRIVERSAPDAAAMLMSLTPDQIEALKRQWARDNRTFAREHVLDGKPEERRRAQVKRTIAQIERWTGPLTDGQERRIADLINALPEVAQLRHQERLRRQNEFLQMLELRRNRERFVAELRRWLADWESGRAPEFAERYARSVELRAEMVIAVDRMLTAEQRTHVRDRVRSYIDDFRILAEPHGTRTAAH